MRQTVKLPVIWDALRPMWHHCNSIILVTDSLWCHDIGLHYDIPDSKVHGANMGPIWGRQDPGGPHVLAPWTLLSGMIWNCMSFVKHKQRLKINLEKFFVSSVICHNSAQDHSTYACQIADTLSLVISKLCFLFDSYIPFVEILLQTSVINHNQPGNISY